MWLMNMQLWGNNKDSTDYGSKPNLSSIDMYRTDLTSSCNLEEEETSERWQILALDEPCKTRALHSLWGNAPVAEGHSPSSDPSFDELWTWGNSRAGVK